MGMETTPYSFGDLIIQRRVDIKASCYVGEAVFKDTRGVVIRGFRGRKSRGGDYLVRAFFPFEGKFRTVRASKIEHI